MGELAVSGAAKDVLTTIGLGSCVGLVLLDSSRSTAGLAHVVYPHSTPDTRSGGQPAKYADTVVPALVGAMGRLGSLRGALEAVLVGGARMFAFVRARSSTSVPRMWMRSLARSHRPRSRSASR